MVCTRRHSAIVTSPFIHTMYHQSRKTIEVSVSSHWASGQGQCCLKILCHLCRGRVTICLSDQRHSATPQVNRVTCRMPFNYNCYIDHILHYRRRGGLPQNPVCKASSTNQRNPCLWLQGHMTRRYTINLFTFYCDSDTTIPLQHQSRPQMFIPLAPQTSGNG
jgi:hypothetical protein